MPTLSHISSQRITAMCALLRACLNRTPEDSCRVVAFSLRNRSVADSAMCATGVFRIAECRGRCGLDVNHPLPRGADTTGTGIHHCAHGLQYRAFRRCTCVGVF